MMCVSCGLDCITDRALFCPVCGALIQRPSRMTVITGEKCSYKRCVYEEHKKLADKLHCKVSDLM
jgi:hypothetical protein